MSIVYILHWTTTIIVCAAFVTCLAVRRTPMIHETPLANTGRNLLLGGWGLFAYRMVETMLTRGSLPQSNIGLMAIMLLALGGTCVCTARLFADRQTPCHDCPYSGKPMEL